MDNTLVFIMVKQPKRFFLFFLIDIDFLLKRLIFRKMPFHLLAQKVFLMLRLKFL